MTRADLAAFSLSVREHHLDRADVARVELHRRWLLAVAVGEGAPHAELFARSEGLAVAALYLGTEARA